MLGFEQLDLIEDVIQDALLKALRTWPYSGTPDNPGAWLVQVARNRAIDVLRRHRSWKSKQDLVAEYLEQLAEPLQSVDDNTVTDEQLQMMFACCHPAINSKARVALTLKAVSGFSVAEIAKAFLLRESTVAQRLVRAKRRIREHKVDLSMPAANALQARLDSVLQVIYLLFNEGYEASHGNDLTRPPLCFEAIRLGHCLIQHAGFELPKTHALMALMYLQAARLPARSNQCGELLIIAEQDRSCWDVGMIATGMQHLQQSATGYALTNYHLEAEISACHVVAKDFESTNWRQILNCYDQLYQSNPSLVIAINRTVALMYADGPQSAHAAMQDLETDQRVLNYYPYYVTRAAIAEQLGLHEQQQVYLQRALQLADNASVKRFLMKKIAKTN